MKLFKVDHFIIDVEESKVINATTGKLMIIDFKGMTYRDFDSKRLAQPIMIDSTGELLFWFKATNKDARWYKCSELYVNSHKAIKRLMEIKIEDDLLK